MEFFIYLDLHLLIFTSIFEEGRSNETTIEIPSRNESQQRQVEDREQCNMLLGLVVFVICFCFFGWLIFSIPFLFLVCFALIYWGLPGCYMLGGMAGRRGVNTNLFE